METRFQPPSGFERIATESGSFAEWLRRLPLRPGKGRVNYYNGRAKGDQSSHVAVVDLDIGKKDLQQCADAVMRIRADYLWESGNADKVCFKSTSGQKLPWSRWSSGKRMRIKPRKVIWVGGSSADDSYTNFQAYLESVFIVAGTWSLQRELEKVSAPLQIEIGDVFIQGGFPGHVVMVVDVAQNAKGQRVFLLAQGFTPAQDIHILAQPDNDSPWYPARDKGALETPGWNFEVSDLRRFGKSCAQ